MAMSRATMLFGTDVPPAETRMLRAGPLTVELEGGTVRYVRYGGIEAVRGIDYLVRDGSWATPTARLSDLTVEEEAGQFLVRYVGTIDEAGIGYRYRATIEGSERAGLRFHVEGEALEAFETSRCGFVVLHAIKGVAGAPVTVTHTDGREEATTFPLAISPSQPIFDIRSLRHRPAPGLAVTCRMEASLPLDPAGKFEMEDQRNWTDASYKTYVGSLLDPWPYRLEKGQALAQTVTVTFDGDAGSAAAARGPDGARLRPGKPAGRAMPPIGVGMMPEDAASAGEATALARSLGPRHLVGWLEPDAGDALPTLESYRAVAEACAAPLQLEIVLPNVAAPSAELARAAALCREAGLAPAAVLVCPRPYLKSYQPSGPWPDVPPLEQIYRAARAAFPNARIGGGMLSYFTELNRKRPPAAAIDFVSHTTCPIVHAADDRSVMETLEALPSVALSVRTFCPQTAYRVGPSAIGMRRNAYGTAPMPNPGARRLAMVQADPRQRGLFAAAWTVGYAAGMVAAGVEALAINHLTGPSGVLTGDADAASAGSDAQARSVRPVFHVMRALCGASGASCVDLEVGGEGIAALAWQRDGTTTILAANLGDRQVSLDLGGPMCARVLDATAFIDAGRDPDWLDRSPARQEIRQLDLDAYAVAFLLTG
jgi:hypothetical protein